MAPLQSRSDAAAVVAADASRSKRWPACSICRARKVRCNGGNPCTYCYKHGQNCETPERRRGILKEKALDSETMTQRLARLETLLEAGSYAPSSIQSNMPMAGLTLPLTQTKEATTSHSIPQASASPLAQPARDQFYAHSAGNFSALVQNAADLPIPETVNVASNHSMLQQASERCYGDHLLDNSPENCDEEQEGSSVYSAETYLEYQGPRCFMSICSQPGIEWVSGRVKVPSFHKSATRFTGDMTCRLKLGRKLPAERAPEPEPESAWKYSKAYFEKSYDASFGIVQRPWFEARLRAHLGNAKSDDEPSWYALRNIIYASGSRIEMSTRTNFSSASQMSWPWFENALSAHTDILYLPTSIVGVQALILMAYYTEGLGSPLLQYMLCSNAIRLACSKGLHRQPAPSWHLSKHEIGQRNWIFWAIYCLEKHISSRSGRPSVMEDEEINCQIPSSAPSEGSVNVTACTLLIKLHQLSSFVGKSLSSARAFRQKPEELMKVVYILDQKVRTLADTTKHVIHLGSPLDPSRLPEDVSLDQALSIQFTYYGLLFDIHTALTYPWSRGIINLRRHPAFRNQVETSYTIVAEGSRAVIMATRHIHLDANCPFLLAYYIPIFALINLFIHIVQAPNLPSVQSDLLLMDIGVAHFARLELATESQISTPFVKDLSQLAHNIVDDSRNAKNEGVSNILNVGETTLTAVSTPRLAEMDAQDVPPDDGFYHDWLDTNFDTDMDMWSTLLPIVDREEGSMEFPAH